MGGVEVYCHVVLISELGGGEQSTWCLDATIPRPLRQSGHRGKKKICRCGMEP